MDKTYRKYGNFSKDGTEFVIKRPDTPRPWINYLSNGKYCALVSQTAGGFSFYLDPGVNRLTRWLPENYIYDRPGRYVYIRDTDTGEFWSATYQPVKKSEKFLCRHGLGYTVIESEYKGIKASVSLFVPQESSAEICLVRISNESRKKRNLQVFLFNEWLLGDWMAELSTRNLTILMNRGEYDTKEQLIVVSKMPWGNKPWNYCGFMGTSLDVRSYDTDYESFIGRYRDYSNPVALESGKCSNSVAHGTNQVGVLQGCLKLAPGKSEEFTGVLGIAGSKKEAVGIIKKFRSPASARKEFDKNKMHWYKKISGNINVKTPAPELDVMVNVWLKYQIYMNNHWGRSATFYHEGTGEFGYRNTAQDAWGIIPINHEYAKERIIMLTEHQRSSGQPLPGWSLQAGPSTHRPPSDFPMWFPFLVNAYIKETGDFDILNEKVKYYDGKEDSVYEHIKKAVMFLKNINKGSHELPLMGTQDWNDALDRTGIRGKGESVWLGMGLCVALKNMNEIASRVGDKETADYCSEKYEQTKKIINDIAWDGSWYYYAFNDFGEPLGSSKNTEGKIQLNAQTWAILAGLPDGERLNKILQVIDKQLATPYGPVLFAPPYTKYDEKIGRITAFAVGTKENAAIFSHGGAFKVMADLQLGRGDKAYKTFNELLPNSESKDVEIYKTEPYVLAEYLIGPGNPNYGEGAFTWLTGAADWLFIDAVNWMLGARPEYDGLLIDPCIPASWKEYKISRQFRGVLFDIHVRNPNGVNKGIKQIKVDGEIVKSNLLKISSGKKKHKVEVILGER
ncbi:MAG: glycosyl transferase family 36 [Elusimicrobia bacterium]|nr:glycosyl transferase family 36 [Elusimicrobiota bacterium]